VNIELYSCYNNNCEQWFKFYN